MPPHARKGFSHNSITRPERAQKFFGSTKCIACNENSDYSGPAGPITLSSRTAVLVLQAPMRSVGLAVWSLFKTSLDSGVNVTRTLVRNCFLARPLGECGKRNGGNDPMKCRFTVFRLSVGLLLGVAGTFSSWTQQTSWAQQMGYVAPNFSQMGGPNGAMHQGSQIPTHMASPLAGGPAAAAGGEFVDVHGNAIVMPATYEQCMSGYGPSMAPCEPCGDPMAIDFGGYSEDQIGPHYFDVAFGTVFLKSDNVLNGVGPLASITAGGTRILEPADSLDEYEAGWQVALRYDLGPLSLFEASYMGLYDIGFSNVIRSVDVTTMPAGQDFQLFTVFSNFGVPTPIDGLDDGSVYALDYQSDLQSTELSYRRYWVGDSSRISGTYLLGFRYLRMTEDLNFDIQALAGNSNIDWATNNDLLGFQLGGDGWFGLRQGLRIGCEGKAGVYNNRFEFASVGAFPAVGNAPDDFAISTDGNQVAFIGEAGVSVVADIWPSWSIRAGYHAYYIDNLATVAANVDPTIFVPTTISSENDALYFGFSAGAEYVW